MKNHLEDYKQAASILPGSVIIFQFDDSEIMDVLFYNQQAKELTGMNKTEVDNTISNDGLKFIIENDKKIIIEKIKQAISGKKELDAMFRQHHKIKGVIWVHMKAVIVGDLNNKPLFVATLLDVTDEMMNSTHVMESSDRAICVIEKDTKILLYANSSFYALINKNAVESTGLHCYDVMCGLPKFKGNDKCLCFSTINIEKPYEYYNPDTKQYLSMYGRETKWGEHEAYVFFLTNQTQEKFKEKQLLNAQERFNMTLDNTDLYIWEYDIVNNQCINPDKAVREYGLPPVIENYPEALFEMDHTPPETISQIKEVKKRLQNGESGFSVERRTVNSKGVSQWMKVSYTLEKDINGNPVRALACGLDITEQKKKESEYKEEIRLKKTVTSDTSVLAILNLTQDSVKENEAQNPMLSKLLLNGKINKVMNDVCDFFITESDQEGYRKHFNREKILWDYDHGIMRGVYRHQFKHLIGWYESAYDLIKNPFTNDIEAICTMKNVTDEVRTKHVLNKLTSIDYEVISTVDVETDQVYVFKLGENNKIDAGRIISAEEFVTELHENIIKYTSKEDAKKIIEDTNKENVIRKLNESPMCSLLFSLNINGEMRRKRNIYSYLDDSHKTILCATQDITESYLQEEKQRQELSKALKKAEIANQAKTSFLSRVSHDMRTPLNGVLGLTALLKDSITDPKALNDLDELEMSGKYLLNLINDTLDVSRIENGKFTLNPEVCDGRIFLNNVINLAMPAIKQKRIHFNINVNDIPFTLLYIDVSRMNQVILNVLGNATKFTPIGGRIDMYLENISVEDGIITDKVVISDNGIGISKDFLPHIFEAFSQEDSSSKNSRSGTGLGMSITKQILEMSNGSISVESELGKGTTFTLVMKLPIATEKQIREWKKSEPNNKIDFNFEGKRVLLCEDHPLNTKIAIRILNSKGITVDSAENGKIGLEMFKKSKLYYYDCILMDIRMPIMDGLEATQKIRLLDREDALTVPIIAMTANAFVEDIKATKKAGMNAHLSKPFENEELFKTIGKFMHDTPFISKHKILIVDDVEVNREVLRSALESDYDIIEASDGVQAMNIIEHKRVDAVITDIQMPNMDGFELIQWIRSNVDRNYITIIANTQFGDPEQEEQLLAIGANDFVYKPTTPKIVEIRVRNALRRY